MKTRKNQLPPNQARYLRKKDKEYLASAKLGLEEPQPSNTLRIETGSHKFVATLLAFAAISALVPSSAEATVPTRARRINPRLSDLATTNNNITASVTVSPTGDTMMPSVTNPDIGHPTAGVAFFSTTKNTFTRAATRQCPPATALSHPTINEPWILDDAFKSAGWHFKYRDGHNSRYLLTSLPPNTEAAVHVSTAGIRCLYSSIVPLVGQNFNLRIRRKGENFDFTNLEVNRDAAEVDINNARGFCHTTLSQLSKCEFPLLEESTPRAKL